MRFDGALQYGLGWITRIRTFLYRYSWVSGSAGIGTVSARVANSNTDVTIQTKWYNNSDFAFYRLKWAKSKYFGWIKAEKDRMG